MRALVSFVLGLLLALSGCGEGDTPQELPKAARAVVVEPASEPEPKPAPAAEPTEPPPSEPAPRENAEPAPEPAAEPEKGGDEEFQPPSNWCGTGRVGGYYGGVVFWLYTNAKGEKKYVRESEVTLEMLQQLSKDGWKLERIVSSRERDDDRLRDLMKRLKKDR